MNSARSDKIVVFTGHMMDRPGRTQPRFPASLEEVVKHEIRAKLDELDARIGFASAACGGDIIFLEQILDRGGEIHVVLPYRDEIFKEDCLTGFQPEAPVDYWRDRFDRLIAQAKTRICLAETRAANNAMASELCNRVYLGLALMKARLEGQTVRMLALWDGWSGDAPGGTRALVNVSQARGVPIEFFHSLRPIDLKSVFNSTVPAPGFSSQPPRPANATEPPQELRAVLFADVLKFSKLSETQLPAFVKHYLHPLAQLIRSTREEGLGPCDFNTWGDGLYCVFDAMKNDGSLETVRGAGLFALRLREFLQSVDWAKKGLPKDMGIRVGLHVGPVYRFPDPFLPRDTFMSSAVSFAARIEPVAQPGEIYCSEAFAALAEAEGVTEFSCESLGEKQLPKLTQLHRLYVLR